jgi:hypothetical protein
MPVLLNPKLGTGALFQYSWDEPGDYTLLLVAANEQCRDTTAIRIQVINLGLFLTVSKTLVNQEETIVLQTRALLPYEITAWRPLHLFPEQQAGTQNLQPDSSRAYTAIARSEEGCIDSASVVVKVNPTIFLPNAFSPNGDGMNDYFKPISGGDDLIIGLFQVFNRNGQVVYQANGVAASKMGWAT